MGSNSKFDSPSWRNIFGHPSPYGHQERAIKTARDVIRERGFYVVESGCGTGKTMTGLTVAGDSIRDHNTIHQQAMILTSVIQQVKQFVSDARIINRNLPDDVEPFKTVVLLGKSNICPYTLTGENDFEDANTNRKCNSLRRNTSKAGRNDSFFNVMKSAERELEQQRLGSSSRALEVDDAEAPYPAEHPVEYGKDVCPFYAKSREQEGYVPFDFSDAEDYVIDTDELVRLSVEHGVCPHTAMSRLLDDADFIIGNYYHAFDFNTLRLTNELIDETTLLCCDEAHMLEPRVRGVLSHEVTMYDFYQGMRELLQVATATGHGGDFPVRIGSRPDAELVNKTLGKHGIPGSLLVQVAELLKFVKQSAEEHAEDFLNREYPQWESRGDSMPSQLEAPLRDPEVAETDRLTEKIEESGFAPTLDPSFSTLADAIQECLTKSDLDDVPGELSFPKVARLLDQWRERDHEQHFREVTLERRWNQNMNGFQKHWRVTLELHNCLPGGLIASQLSKFGGGLLMSATLKPFNVYKDVVGLDYLEHQHDRPVVTDTFIKKFPDENQASYIIDAPKFTSSNRGYPDEWTDVRKQYARAILSVARTPGNILVCMPSYAEAEWAADILERTSQFDKEVLCDSSSSNDETERLKEEFFEGDGKILVTSIRGTLTEGVDYKGDRLHGVVVAGVPIPNVGSPRVRALQFAYELEYGSLGFAYSMFVPAVRKTRQALGRVIRGEEDVGVRVLVDERYANNGSVRQYLSDFERDRYDVVDVGSLQQRIESFWTDHGRF